jgi:hypothetical protein
LTPLTTPSKMDTVASLDILSDGNWGYDMVIGLDGRKGNNSSRV